MQIKSRLRDSNLVGRRSFEPFQSLRRGSHKTLKVNLILGKFGDDSSLINFDLSHLHGFDFFRAVGRDNDEPLDLIVLNQFSIFEFVRLTFWT